MKLLRVILLSVLIIASANAAKKKKKKTIPPDQAAKARAVQSWVHAYKAADRQLPALKKRIEAADQLQRRTMAAVKKAKDESKTKFKVRSLQKELERTDMMCHLAKERVVRSSGNGATDYRSIRDRHHRIKEQLAILKHDPDANPKAFAAAASDFVASRNILARVDESMESDINLQIATRLSDAFRSEIEWEYCSAVYRQMLGPTRRMIVKASDDVAEARRKYDSVLRERDEMKRRANKALRQ